MRLLLLFVWLLGTVAAAQTDRTPYTIAALSGRAYGGGTITSERVLERNGSFTRYLIRWNSDGLRQYGFLNVPVAKSKTKHAVLMRTLRGSGCGVTAWAVA
jgi:uncharacterized protein